MDNNELQEENKSMGYSTVVVTDAQSVDIVSPGAPAFAARPMQVNNKEWSVEIILPSVDADGSELTGMVTLTLATLPMSDGLNPFIGLTMLEIKVLPGVIFQDVAIEPGEAGTSKVLIVPIINLNGVQAFAAAVAD